MNDRYRNMDGSDARFMRPDTTAASKSIEALKAAKEKLSLYRSEHSGEYIGGTEYSALIKQIDDAITMETCTKVAAKQPREDTTVDRVYFCNVKEGFAINTIAAFAVMKDGREWRLSEAEITRALNRPNVAPDPQPSTDYIKHVRIDINGAVDTDLQDGDTLLLFSNGARQVLRKFHSGLTYDDMIKRGMSHNETFHLSRFYHALGDSKINA